MVKMVGSECYSSPKVPFLFDQDHIIETYAYILIPYIRGVTLLEYLNAHHPSHKDVLAIFRKIY